MRAREQADPESKFSSVPALRDLGTQDLVELYLQQIKSIYGEDDRTDIIDLPAEDPVRATADGVISLFLESDIRDNNDGDGTDPLSGTVTLIGQPFGTKYRPSGVG